MNVTNRLSKKDQHDNHPIWEQGNKDHEGNFAADELEKASTTNLILPEKKPIGRAARTLKKMRQ